MADDDLPGFRSIEEARAALERVLASGETPGRVIVRGEPCTPSTEHVRGVYAAQHGDILVEEHGREFDRWLAQAQADAGTWERTAASVKEAADAFLTEGDRLRAVIENAPHAHGSCLKQTDEGFDDKQPCTCWKVDAIG